MAYHSPGDASSIAYSVCSVNAEHTEIYKYFGEDEKTYNSGVN
jgi:hypothetical protein